MASFSVIVLAVAAVVLVVLLAYMGSIMSSAKTNVVFPPAANVCPDNWTATATGTCTAPAAGGEGANIGALTASSANVSASGAGASAVLSIDPAGVAWAASGKSSICGKKSWADSNGVMWDGISNYNSC